jgi:hypothetical protein
VKAGGRTPQVSFHPSRDQEIESEANAIAADLEIAKRDPGTLKKYVRVHSPLLSSLQYHMCVRLCTEMAIVVSRRMRGMSRPFHFVMWRPNLLDLRPTVP